MNIYKHNRPCYSESFASLKSKLCEESQVAARGFFAVLRMTGPILAVNVYQV